MKTAIYNQKGEKVDDFALPKAIFGLPWFALECGFGASNYARYASKQEKPVGAHERQR